jgi:hypothetical protein
MKPILYSFFALLLAQNVLVAQALTCSPEDRQLFEAKITALVPQEDRTMGETMVYVGKSFLGTPYVAKTLEVGPTETLVVNLQGLDCTTFVENVLALSSMLQDKQTAFTDFTDHLETIRYIDGKMNGYASRLHYFSEWIANNSKKGLVMDVTGELGGKEITKDINFMSTHRHLYPFLADDSAFDKIKASENYLNDQAICVLAQDQITQNEHLIQTGDIIALATSMNGLDVTHTGLALKMANGRVHLLHASTVGEVVISKVPLVDYLKNIKHNTGIMVARPL